MQTCVQMSALRPLSNMSMIRKISGSFLNILEKTRFSNNIDLIHCSKKGLLQRFTTGVTSDKLEWSYLHGKAEEPLIGVTIGKLLQQRAEKHPSKEAVYFCSGGQGLNFQQLLEESDRLAAGLLAIGIKKGDRVGIWAPNCLAWILTQFGTARAGIIMVNINPAYQTTELEFALKKVGVKCIIAEEHFKTQEYYKMLHKLCPELDSSKPGALISHRLPDLQSIIMLSNKDFPGAFKFSDVMEAGESHHFNDIHNIQNKLQFDDPVNIQFTSGTTGSPKGATLTHHNIVNNSRNVGMRMEYHIRDTRICIPVPLFHCFGMVMGSLQCLTNGATAIFPSPSFDPVTALQAVSDKKCTSLYGTPTMFIDMLNLHDFNKYDLTSLYTGIMAGSICPIEIMKQVVEKMHMKQVTICYGSTENSPVTFQSLMNDPLDKRVTSVGIPSQHVEVKVVNENGEILPVGEKGELCIRGYGTMLNYWNEPLKTKEVITEHGWYHTGDLGIIDSDGYGYIVGRLKDMIIRGGENIYPAEVEDFLYTHPKVENVQVIGVTDKRLGEKVCAWIKLKEGEHCTDQDIKDFCKGKIAHFKVPQHIQFVKEYPLTVTGKVKKFVMREEMNKLLQKQQ